MSSRRTRCARAIPQPAGTLSGEGTVRASSSASEMDCSHRSLFRPEHWSATEVRLPRDRRVAPCATVSRSCWAVSMWAGEKGFSLLKGSGFLSNCVITVQGSMRTTGRLAAP